MTADGIDRYVLRQMQRALAETGVYLKGINVEGGVVRLGYVPTSGDWTHEMSQVMGMYLNAETQGLGSERLEAAVFCPNCWEEVVTTYSVLAAWADDYDQEDAEAAVVDRVMETVEHREH